MFKRGRHATGVRRYARRQWLVLTPAVMLVGTGLVWQATYATMTGKASAPTSFTSGTVAFGSSASALFTVTGMVPSNNTTPVNSTSCTGGTNCTGNACIKITYSGTAQGNVKLYATEGSDTGLGSYLAWTVEYDATQTDTCASFSPSPPLYTGSSTNTLASFESTYSNFATGLDTWTPTNGQIRLYRFTYSLVKNSLASGKTASLTLTWQANARAATNE